MATVTAIRGRGTLYQKRMARYTVEIIRSRVANATLLLMIKAIWSFRRTRDAISPIYRWSKKLIGRKRILMKKSRWEPEWKVRIPPCNTWSIRVRVAWFTVESLHYRLAKRLQYVHGNPGFQFLITKRLPCSVIILNLGSIREYRVIQFFCKIANLFWDLSNYPSILYPVCIHLTELGENVMRGKLC